MGEVYKARDPRLHRLVALKLLPAGATTDPERRERFEREAQAVAALNHPHIVTIYSVEQADGQFFLTMELRNDLEELKTSIDSGEVQTPGVGGPASDVADRRSPWRPFLSPRRWPFRESTCYLRGPPSHWRLA